MASRIEGNFNHVGTVTFSGGMVVPTALVLPTYNMDHQHVVGYSQPNTTATTETRTLRVVQGTAGTTIKFSAGSIVANIGAATVTVDLKKNGASILSAVITLNSSSTARIAQNATISDATLAAGDWLEIVITATAGGGTLATGVFAQLVTDEDYN